MNENIFLNDITKKMKDAMDYNEKVKIVNEYILKFNQMMMVFSIGIIAFSIQTIEKDSEYIFKAFLFIFWITLGLTFFLGLVRMHHQQKIMTRNAAEAFDSEVLKKKIDINKERMKRTNRTSARLYRLMLLCFCVGIISFGFFKVANL